MYKFKYKTILIVLLSLGISTQVFSHGSSLWQHFESDLPNLKIRAEIYEDSGNSDIYIGSYEQNQSLLESLHDSSPILGSLAPLPGPTVEGTSTAGWTDDGSIVRLNTQADNVGIGTLNPSVKLQVQGAGYFTGNLNVSGGTLNFSNGSATSTFTQISNGNLGIGTTTPSSRFSVQGGAYFSGTTTVSNFVLASSTMMLNGVTYIWPSAQGSSGQILQTDGVNSLSWTAKPGGWLSNLGSTTLETITDNVGIGTTSPATKLSVHGNALIAGTTTVATLNATNTIKIAGSKIYQSVVYSTSTSLILVQTIDETITTTFRPEFVVGSAYINQGNDNDKTCNFTWTSISHISEMQDVSGGTAVGSGKSHLCRDVEGDSQWTIKVESTSATSIVIRIEVHSGSITTGSAINALITGR